MNKVQLDNNKILKKAIVRALEMAETDLQNGHCKFNPITKAFEPRRSAREVMKRLGFSWRNGHLRAVSAAYRAVFFNASVGYKGAFYER